MNKLKLILSKVYGIISESDGKLSIGRTLLLALIILASFRWMHGLDIPETMITLILTLVGYIFGGKTISSISDIFGKINETKTAISGVLKKEE